MKNYNRNSLIGLFKAFKYSLSGFKTLIKSETAFKHDIIFVVIITPIVIYIAKPHLFIMMYLISSAILILIIEAVNSAIESACDAISEEYNKLIGRAKDIGSFAVLLAVTNYIIVSIAIIFNSYNGIK